MTEPLQDAAVIASIVSFPVLSFPSFPFLGFVLVLFCFVLFWFAYFVWDWFQLLCFFFGFGLNCLVLFLCFMFLHVR